MSTEKIRAEIEKIRTLSSLQKELSDALAQKSGKELSLARAKLSAAREEMLKSTYSIGKLLTNIEEKV